MEFSPCPKPLPREKRPRQPLKSKSRMKSKPDLIPPKIKKQIIERDIYCQGCGRPGVHIHHIVYRSHGGKHTPENLVYLCGACHDRAHGFREWREYWVKWIKDKVGE